MIRQIIEIDRDLCDGCGKCITGCHEGALRLVDGKAALVREDYCDGLGACIGDCPLGAIRLVEKEAAGFDQQAVAQHLSPGQAPDIPSCQALGTPRSQETASGFKVAPQAADVSALTHWPVQLHLINPLSAWLAGSHLLLAADCSAFASGGFHRDLLQGHVLAIACPKLDNRQEDYVTKLCTMIDHGGIRSLTVLTMTVPCCGGLYRLAELALSKSARRIPLSRIMMAPDGTIHTP